MSDKKIFTLDIYSENPTFNNGLPVVDCTHVWRKSKAYEGARTTLLCRACGMRKTLINKLKT